MPAALALAEEEWPGRFGVYYEAKDEPTKNKLERDLIDATREKIGQKSDRELLSQTFASMR